jgi:Asp-tRNA(Asn)/Glu-tRNA(Gln) amidotransferase A subunit family amidase
VHTLEEVLASGKYHKSIETALRNAQAYEARESSEYLKHWRMRDILREAILKVMADNTLDALAYPSVRLKPSLIGEAQGGNNCRLSSNSGLPSIVVPGGFTPDGLPIGVELLGRPWGESQLIKFGYAYEQGTNHRRSPSTTPPLGRL